VDSISKFHAYFTLDGDQWALTDYRSSNGTEISGKRIEPYVATRVKDGDPIPFGENVSVAFLEPRSLHAKLIG